MEWILYSLNSKKPNIYNIPKFMLQVYNRIVAIYNKDFIYQDLKPRNILIKINNNGLTFKIADFRKLKFKALENITTITNLILYMAPKLYTDLPYFKAINMWSFKFITLELLTN